MAEPALGWSMKLYEGLSKDIEQLMSNFVQTSSVRYEGFARTWQEMNFSLVYCGLRTMEHKKEFIEEAFRLSALYMSPPFDFQQRTGGLYIIYAFYFTQRHRPRIKVRLSCKQWKNLLEMEAELKKQGHLDAYYILLKLKMHKAFCFAYSSQQFLFKNPATDENQDKWLAENQREIEQAFPESLLRKLHETHHKYQFLKSQLGVAVEKNLKHVKHSMAEVIAKRFQDLEENVENDTAAVNHRDHISKLKEKSFSHRVESDERITSTSSNITSSSESDHFSSPLRKRGRPPMKIQPVQPDTRPMIEKLMPVLKKYDLSDSEDEEKPKPEAAAPKESPKKLPKPRLKSPAKRKRKGVKVPTAGSPVKRKKGKSSPSSMNPSATKKRKSSSTKKHNVMHPIQPLQASPQKGPKTEKSPASATQGNPKSQASKSKKSKKTPSSTSHRAPGSAKRKTKGGKEPEKLQKPLNKAQLGAKKVRISPTKNQPK